MIGQLIEMVNYIINKKVAFKLTIHFAPGFISKIETHEKFKLQNWEKILK